MIGTLNIGFEMEAFDFSYNKQFHPEKIQVFAFSQWNMWDCIIRLHHRGGSYEIKDNQFIPTNLCITWMCVCVIKMYKIIV